MILFIVPFAAWLWNQAADIASGVSDFLRSIPSLIAPKPTPLGAPYTPPFTGGQCLTSYAVTYRCFKTTTDGLESGFPDPNPRTVNANGAIKAIYATYGTLTASNGYTSVGLSIDANTDVGLIGSDGSSGTGIISVRGEILSVVRNDGQPDNCGNLSNPTPLPSINNGGLFKPTNLYITDSNDIVNPSAIVLAPALPLVLVAAITGGYMAAMAAAKAASDALEAVKKIAEGLEALKKLWDKLQEFLDEWEKNRPKKRDITRQTYGQILGDGALDFFAPNSKKVEAIQLDIVVTSIPATRGKYFGNLSPHRYRYGQYLSDRELGYVAFYSVNQGILEVHSIQFKRTTLEIPKLAVGFIYHFGLDEQIKAFAFGTFSIEKT